MKSGGEGCQGRENFQPKEGAELNFCPSDTPREAGSSQPEEGWTSTALAAFFSLHACSFCLSSSAGYRNRPLNFHADAESNTMTLCRESPASGGWPLLSPRRPRVWRGLEPKNSMCFSQRRLTASLELGIRLLGCKSSQAACFILASSSQGSSTTWFRV